jgi:hypothetical protein
LRSDSDKLEVGKHLKTNVASLSLNKVRQLFERPVIGDVGRAVADELAQVRPAIVPGSRIAIAVGSRGIADIVPIVASTVDVLKGQGAIPFIVPAMGSHGGATAEGQTEVLRSYGIAESTVGAPVRSSMDTVELPLGRGGNRVFMDRLACESDGVVLINRVKPHTDYHGPYESGLVKMSVIGLGKHDQALEIHSHGVYGLRELIPPTAEGILSTGKILFGVAIIENAFDETMQVKVLRADEILREEPQLLEVARAHMPRLPVDVIDVLIVDRLGKDISGCGMDPNTIGRMMIRGESEPLRPNIKAILVTDLTPGSHGNALGIGLADVITQKLFDKIDTAAMYENTVTSSFLERGKIPIVAADDATAYAYARRSCGVIPDGLERIVRIRDTLHLGDVYVSDAILADLTGRSDIEVSAGPCAVFSESGTLNPF